MLILSNLGDLLYIRNSASAIKQSDIGKVDISIF